MSLSSINNNRRKSYGLWTAEEKQEIDIGLGNQRRAAEFVTNYMFYGGE